MPTARQSNLRRAPRAQTGRRRDEPKAARRSSPPSPDATSATTPNAEIEPPARANAYTFEGQHPLRTDSNAATARRFPSSSSTARTPSNTPSRRRLPTRSPKGGSPTVREGVVTVRNPSRDKDNSVGRASASERRPRFAWRKEIRPEGVADSTSNWDPFRVGIMFRAIPGATCFALAPGYVLYPFEDSVLSEPVAVFDGSNKDSTICAARQSPLWSLSLSSQSVAAEVGAGGSLGLRRM